MFEIGPERDKIYAGYECKDCESIKIVGLAASLNWLNSRSILMPRPNDKQEQ